MRYTLCMPVRVCACACVHMCRGAYVKPKGDFLELVFSFYHVESGN